MDILRNNTMSGSHFEDDMTHDTLLEYKIVWKADWALVIASHCFWVVLSAIASGISLSYCVIAAILFPLQISCHFSRLSYFFFQNWPVVLSMIGFLSFITQINCTVSFVISFGFCWVSFLSDRGVVCACKPKWLDSRVVKISRWPAHLTHYWNCTTCSKC